MGWYERRVLPVLLDKMMTGAETVRLRQDALAQARGRVLGIGFGTGLNVPHYPPAVTQLMLGGCNLNRPIAKVVVNAGFTLDTSHEFFQTGAPKFAGWTTSATAGRQ